MSTIDAGWHGATWPAEGNTAIGVKHSDLVIAGCWQAAMIAQADIVSGTGAVERIGRAARMSGSWPRPALEALRRG